MSRVSAREALAMLRDEDFLALCRAADRVAVTMNGDRVRTFAVDRNINWTNLCTSGCRFCAFFRANGAADAYVLSDDELLAKVAEAVERGATHILLQGGLHPELGLEEAERLLRLVRSRFDVHLHWFSPPEVVHFARLAGTDVPTVLARLRDAGLGSLPGGGAEILSDRVRQLVSPHKCSVAEWLGVMRAAHELGLRTTATMMFGHAESLEERIEHLVHVRRLQDETGGFTSFICWPFQARNTALGADLVGGRIAAPWSPDGRWRETTAVGYLRTLATARITLDNVRHVQASWVTMGPKVGQTALRLGADDLGSTMMEENVVRAAGVSHEQSREELVRLIADAGFEPRQRDCLYERTWPATEGTGREEAACRIAKKS